MNNSTFADRLKSLVDKEFSVPKHLLEAKSTPLSLDKPSSKLKLKSLSTKSLKDQFKISLSENTEKKTLKIKREN